MIKPFAIKRIGGFWLVEGDYSLYMKLEDAILSVAKSFMTV